MITTFTRKRIDLTITLGSGEFGEDAGDTVTIRNARVMVDAVNPGGETMGAAQIRVYGLSQSLMNQLTTIGQLNQAIRIKNTVSVAAGDEFGMSLMFVGTIVTAIADYNAAPEVGFMIMSNAGMGAAVKPVNATAYKGATPVIQIMADLAAEGEFALDGEDPEIQLTNPYLPGSTLNKIKAVCRAAGLQYVIERGTLAFWKTGQSRRPEGSVPLISKDTGMIGYPELSSKGMTVRCMYNPNIRYGADIEVQTELPMANGRWHVSNYSHNISAETPGGPWMTTIEAYRVES